MTPNEVDFILWGMGALLLLATGSYGYTWIATSRLWDYISRLAERVENHLTHDVADIQQDIESLKGRVGRLEE